jgi:hypothetical protein
VSLWGAAVVVALRAAAAIELDDSTACVARDQLEHALAEVGGVDELTERVAVRIGPAASDDGALAVVAELRLSRVRDVVREAAFLPHECSDVPELVAVWVQAQRRTAQQKNVQRSEGEEAPRALSRADRAFSRSGVRRARDPLVMADDWSACSGPADCGGPRASLAVGPALGFGPDRLLRQSSGRLQLDASTRVTERVHLEGVVAFDGTRDSGAFMLELGPGVAGIVPLGALEASLHGSVSLGLTSCPPKNPFNASSPPPSVYACVVSEESLGVANASLSLVAVPRVAARFRFGYGFVELGATAHLGATPPLEAYLLFGLAPFR